MTRSVSPELGVLVADDDPAVLLLLQRALPLLGATVFAAASGREAVEVFQAHPDQVRLALLDLHMPGLDGLAVMVALREVRPSLACCLMGGNLDDPQRYTAAGACCLLAKPFSLAELKDCLRTLCGG